MNEVDAAARAGPAAGVDSPARTPPRPPGQTEETLVTLSEYKSQTVKDYSLTIEYKHLQLRAPSGVYVLPSFDSLRRWHGAIFVRQGTYRDGVFKFRMDIPVNYPADGARPSVTFFTPVFHPLVDPETGELDMEGRFPSWRHGHDYLVFVLVFIKKIFYAKDFPLEDFPYPRNPEAMKLFHNSKRGDGDEFARRVAACVKASVDGCETDNDPASSLQFAPFAAAHQTFFEGLVAPNGRSQAKENEAPEVRVANPLHE
jgi:ubiquitin-protein ligase